MHRRIAASLSVPVVLGAVGLALPIDPVGADVCAGTGSATVAAPGLQYPVVGTARTLGFSATLNTGTCLPGFGGLTATGTVEGYCGHSRGSGTDTDDHLFGFVSAGGILVVTSELTGVVVAVPNVPAGESCIPPNGALQFILAGAVSRVNCVTNLLPGAATVTDLTAPLGDIGVFVQVHTCTGTQL